MLISLQGIRGAGAAILAREVFARTRRQPTTARLLSRPDAKRL
jgi:hypothetical protein